MFKETFPIMRLFKTIMWKQINNQVNLSGNSMKTKVLNIRLGSYFVENHLSYFFNQNLANIKTQNVKNGRTPVLSLPYNSMDNLFIFFNV